MTSNSPDIQANRLHAALATEYEYTDAENVEELVIDTLTDLRHLCDLYGLGFDACQKVAITHYSAEIAKC